MGSMSREALGSARSVLSDLGGAADLATGEQLLDAGRVIGGSVQLQAYFSDPSTDVAVKKQLVDRLFGSFSEAARALLVSVVGSRWSSSRDLLAGIEELGFRVIALSAPQDSGIENELFAFDAVVRSDAQLELAIGTKLSDASSKAGLVQRLLGDKAKPSDARDRVAPRASASRSAHRRAAPHRCRHRRRSVRSARRHRDERDSARLGARRSTRGGAGPTVRA